MTFDGLQHCGVGVSIIIYNVGHDARIIMMYCSV